MLAFTKFLFELKIVATDFCTFNVTKDVQPEDSNNLFCVMPSCAKL